MNGTTTPCRKCEEGELTKIPGLKVTVYRGEYSAEELNLSNLATAEEIKEIEEYYIVTRCNRCPHVDIMDTRTMV